ncbi:MAG TPA: YggS family pyridoxal phosphate enzyme [Streptosporangiaceae bacterium]
MTGGNGRADELRANLKAVRARIAAACQAAGRPADDVTLIAVTKTFPASDVRLLVELGVADIGENRDQEAARKAAECRDLDPRPRWHFVGQLQVNKARSVVRYADVIHSVDRLRLVEVLGARARAAGRVITCLVQVDLGPEPGPGSAERGVPGGRPPGLAERGGAAPGDVSRLADAVAAEVGLTLGGVMAVAPLGAPPRPAFRRLAEVASAVRAAHPDASIISAGMTGDLEEAIAEGATHVRVGTALLGGRQPFVR